MKDTLILGIESSCDETAASVVKNGRTVLSNQLEISFVSDILLPVLPSLFLQNYFPQFIYFI